VRGPALEQVWPIPGPHEKGIEVGTWRPYQEPTHRDSKVKILYKFMEITEDIAEIIGRHIADGYLVKNPKRNGYRVVLTEKREILEDQIKKIEKYFAITSFRIAKRKDEKHL